jgi:hypothetical protein
MNKSNLQYMRVNWFSEASCASYACPEFLQIDVAADETGGKICENQCGATLRKRWSVAI